MKLISDPRWPDWLKRDPVSGYWRVVCYRSDKTPQRLDKSTREKHSVERAKKIGQLIYEKWLGHRLDGGKLRVSFSKVLAQKLEQMEAALVKGKIKPGTMRNARYYMGKDKILDREFGHLYVDQITEGATWGGFVARYQRDNPEGSLFNIWKHMSKAMNHAHKCGYVPAPWTAPNPDPKVEDERIPTAEQITAIFNKASPNLRDQMLFAVTMGMRKMEHLGQSFDTGHCCHVDLEEKTVSLCQAHSKTNRARVMQMSPQVEAMLARRKAGLFVAADGYTRKRKLQSKWVFPARGNPDAHVKSNKTAWRNAKTEAGIFDVLKYHWLRRYFLTECAKLVRNNSVSIALVCRYAGVSIAVFERKYLKLTHKDTAPVSGLVSVKLGDLNKDMGVMH